MKSLLGYRGDLAFRPRKATFAVFRVFAIGMLAVLLTHAGEWQLGVAPDTVGGRYSSFQIDKYGNAHVCSFSPANNVLSYSFWDHSVKKWFTTVLGDSSGFCSLALDSQQRPHISYLGYGTGLNYAHWNGTSWEKQPLKIPTRLIAYNTSIVLDSEDRPYISFYEERGTNDEVRLRTVLWNGKFWELRTIDSDVGSGKFNSIAIDSSGRPAIAYANVYYQNASLRFARWNGQSWVVEIVEGVGAPAVIYSVMMTLEKADVPHIVYTDVLNRLVKYAVKRNGKWEIQVVDKLGRMGYPDRNGIAVDDQGNVYISYYDDYSGVLKLAYKKDNKWVSEVVDQQFSGFASCLRIADGSIWLSYQDETGEELRYARRDLPRGSIEAKPGSPGGSSKLRGERER